MNWARRIPGKIVMGALANCEPSNVSRRWPAIIFAANRTDSVIGRIMFLTSSIKTIKGIKTGGVPKGTRCAKKFNILFTSLKIIKPSHRGRAKASVTAKWLEAVKVKDKRPGALLSRIMMKSLIKRSKLIFLLFIKVANSIFILDKIIIKIA